MDIEVTAVRVERSESEKTDSRSEAPLACCTDLKRLVLMQASDSCLHSPDALLEAHYGVLGRYLDSQAPRRGSVSAGSLFKVHGMSFCDDSETTPSGSEPSSNPRFGRVVSDTMVSYFFGKNCLVFCVDVSPSALMFDTSFQAGCSGKETPFYPRAVLDCLQRGLRAAATSYHACHVDTDCVVLLYGTLLPQYDCAAIVKRQPLNIGSVDSIFASAAEQILKALEITCNWMRVNGPSQLTQACNSCSRDLSGCHHLICKACGFHDMIDKAMNVLLVEGVQVASCNTSLVAVTDGLMSHPKSYEFDNTFMKLNRLGVSVSILQFGGGFAPWSPLGYTSDPAILGHIATLTSCGLYLQSHHLDYWTKSRKELSDEPTSTHLNICERSIWSIDNAPLWLLRVSPECVKGQQGERWIHHVPFDLQSYMGHVGNEGLGCSGSSFELDGVSTRRNLHSPSTPMRGNARSYAKDLRSQTSAILDFKVSKVAVPRLIANRVRDGFQIEMVEGCLSEPMSRNGSSGMFSQTPPKEGTSISGSGAFSSKMPGSPVVSRLADQRISSVGELPRVPSSLSGHEKELKSLAESRSSPTISRNNDDSTTEPSPRSSVSSNKYAYRVVLAIPWTATIDLLYEISSSAVFSTVLSEVVASTASGVSETSSEATIRVLARVPKGESAAKLKQKLTLLRQASSGSAPTSKLIPVDHRERPPTVPVVSDGTAAGPLNLHRIEDLADLLHRFAVAIRSADAFSNSAISACLASAPKSFSASKVKLSALGELWQAIPTMEYYGVPGGARSGVLQPGPAVIVRHRHGAHGESALAAIELVVDTIAKLSIAESKTNNPQTRRFFVHAGDAPSADRASFAALIRAVPNKPRSNQNSTTKFAVRQPCHRLLVVETRQERAGAAAGWFLMISVGSVNVAHEYAMQLADQLIEHLSTVVQNSVVFCRAAGSLLSTASSVIKSRMPWSSGVCTMSRIPSQGHEFTLHLPPAAKIEELLSKIHSERAAAGWACFFESERSLLYGNVKRDTSGESVISELFHAHLRGTNALVCTLWAVSSAMSLQASHEQMAFLFGKDFAIHVGTSSAQIY